MEPPDVICIDNRRNDYDIRTANMMALLEYAFANNDAYLHKRALISYLMIIQERLKAIK